MISKETFKRLVLALAEHGVSETKNINGVSYRAYKVSELTLILAKFKEKWTPEGISFELFGYEFFITPDGSISITDNEDDSDIFSLNDEELLAVVTSFLKWRLSVVDKLHV